MEKIRKLEGLLSWAKAHGEKGEVARITNELAELVEAIWQGVKAGAKSSVFVFDDC